MPRMIRTAKTAKGNRSEQIALPDVSVYCRDLDNWPRSWMGLEKDLPPGEALVVCFRPFIQHLVSTGLSPKIIRQHVDNLWSLGGEIIRNLHYDPSLKKKPVELLLRRSVHEYGGPAVHNASDQ